MPFSNLKVNTKKLFSYTHTHTKVRLFFIVKHNTEQDVVGTFKSSSLTKDLQEFLYTLMGLNP
jgi:hypothetical protein